MMKMVTLGLALFVLLAAMAGVCACLIGEDED